MATTSERLLVQQLRQNDPRAWEHFKNQFEGRLLAFVYRRLRNWEDSQDVFQETVTGFHVGLANFDDNRSLETWLFTIASYKLTDLLRKKGRHPLQNFSEGTDDLMQQQLDSHPGASSLARSQERRELESSAIAKGLTQILDDWRDKEEWSRVQVLELLFVKGWPNKEIATFLQISEQQVANIRFAAVKKLTEFIRDSGLPTDVFPELQEG